MSANAQIVVRPAQRHDAADIAAIYNEGIQRRVATFETRLRTEADIVSWSDNDQYPILVAELEDQVLGWVSASSYRPRDCYAGVAEFSIYVATTAQGRGVGGQLMAAFISACEEKGFWKLVSRIFVENTASRQLCQRLGFRGVGIYEKHAQLDSLWKDVVIVERLLEGNLH
jgi:L-amino acid N-acyltransferase YncA